MAEQNCNRYLDYFVKLVSHTRSFSLGFCVLNFGFSLVATLGNLLVIRALMKTSTIPATVKKLFLSLAFSDLAVGLLPQLMTAIISAVMLKMASSGDDLSFFCPTVLIVLLYFQYLLAAASVMNITVIAFDRVLAVSLHLRYPELVTPIRVTIVLVSLWLTSCVYAFTLFFTPKGSLAMAGAVISIIGYVLTTLANKIFLVAFCVLNFVFSVVATLENLLVIRALMKASTIPATVKKLFLSLAFSDLAVGLCSQLTTAIISTSILKMASSGNNTAFFCPTVLGVQSYLGYLLATASFLNVIVIAFDRLLAVSLHLRYQKLITPKRDNIALVSLWSISCFTAFIIVFLPTRNKIVAAVILLIGYVLTTVAYVRIYKVVKYHLNQIYSQNQLQNAQTREILRQKKSAYNAIFVYLVFLACYLPLLPSTILYMTNTSEISFFVAYYASLFLIRLNSSLNPLVYCWRYREIRLCYICIPKLC
ncbi:melanocyte-stimulating hormone receptor-like [Porites lutea]|uniref:melanocyte-stimulating hormone receptor-like n=1 Tax=Porites lutea TaxID=51062 RepID=UPI003CC6846E